MSNIRLAVDQHGWPVYLSEPSSPVMTTAQPMLPAAQHRDLVRELAREFEDFSDQDLRERLPIEISKMPAGNLMALRYEVRAQVLDDLLDALDQRLRGKLRARRTVRILAPRGYTRKVLASLSSTEIIDLSTRLVARGWTDDDVKRTLPRAHPSRVAE